MIIDTYKEVRIAPLIKKCAKEGLNTKEASKLIKQNDNISISPHEIDRFCKVIFNKNWVDFAKDNVKFNVTHRIVPTKDGYTFRTENGRVQAEQNYKTVMDATFARIEQEN